MANDGREVIGEVSVKVKPDTAGFARETKRRLQAIKALDKERYKVPVEIDTEQLTAKLKTEVARLNARALTDPSFHVKLRTKLEWSTREMRDQVKKHVGRYQELANLEAVKYNSEINSATKDTSGPAVKPTIDTKGLEKSFKDAIDKLSKDIPITIDKTATRAEAAKSASSFREVFDHVAAQKQLRLDIEISEKEVQKSADKWAATFDSVLYNRELVGFDDKLISELTEHLERHTAAWVEAGKAQTHYAELGDKAWRKYARQAEEAYAEVEKLQRQIEDLSRVREQRALSLDIDEASIEHYKREHKKLADDLDNLKAQVDVRLDQGSANFVRAELWELTRDRVKNIFVNVTNLPQMERFFERGRESASDITRSLTKWSAQIVGVRLLWKTATELLEIVPKLDMMIPQIAKMLTVVLAGISAASLGLGALISIAGDAVRIVNLGLMLPTAIGALALSVGIIARAMKDFKTQLPDVVSQFKELGNIASTSYWETARDGIRGLWQALQPMLDVRIPQVADALGRATSSLAEGLERGADSHLDEFMVNLVRGLEEGATGFDQLGEALMRMSGIGSRRLPDLGKWFTEQMTSFNSWVDENDKNGNLERWIIQGEQALRDLGSVLYSTGSMLRSFGRIAKSAGLPGLTEFAESMRDAADAVKSADFQDVASQGLGQMLYMMDTIATQAGPAFTKAIENLWLQLGAAAERLATPVAGALTGILDAFNSDRFQDDLTEFTDGIATFIEDITPGLEAITVAFAGMLGVVGTAAESWGPAFNELLLLISGMGDAVDPGFKDFLENTGPTLLQIVKDLKQPAIDAAAAVGDLLGNEAFQDMAMDLAEALGDIAEALLDMVPPLTDAVEEFAELYDLQPEWLKDFESHVAALVFMLPAFAVGLGLVTKALAPLRAALALTGFSASGFWSSLLGGTLGGKGGGKRAGLLALLRVGTIVGLIGSIVPKNFGTTLMDGIVKALGLDDTWIGSLQKEISDKMQEATGGKPFWTLIGEGIGKGIGKFKEGDFWGGVGEIVDGLESATKPGSSYLFETIMEKLGITDLPGYKFWEELGFDGSLSSMFEALYNFLTTDIQTLWGIWMDKLEEWEPKGVFKIIPWLSKKLGEWLGLAGFDIQSMSFSWDILVDSWGDFLGIEDLGQRLQDAWDTVVNYMKSWEPEGNSWGGIMKWAWDLLVKWLFGGDESNGSSGANSLAMGGHLTGVFDGIWGGIESALNVEWGKLVTKIASFSPAQIAFDFFGLIWKWIKSLFGGGGSGGVLGAVAGIGGGIGGFSLLGYWPIIETGLTRAIDELKNLILGFVPSGTPVDLLGLARKWIFGDGTDTGITGAGGGFSLAPIFGVDEGGLANLGSAFGLARGHVTTFTTGAGSDFTGLRDTASPVFGDLVSKVATGASTMATKFTSALADMKAKSATETEAARSSIVGNLSFSATDIGSSVGRTFVSGLRSGLQGAESAARSIRSGVRDALGFSAYSSGASIGETFAAGIRSKIGAVTSAISTMAQSARDYLPNSPAAVGPLSGSGWGGWGESIAEEMARGLRKGAPEVASQASSLMSGVTDALKDKGDIVLNPRATGRAVGAAAASAAGAAGGGVQIGSVVFQAQPGMSLEEQIAITNAALGSNLNI